MADEYSPRSNFVFAPPENNPGAWQASLEMFRDALQRAFPGAFLETTVSSLRSVPVLDFEIEAAPGVFVAGTAAMPAPGYAHVTLVDVTVGEAALFAQWLRDSFVPSPASVRFLSSFVMENGVETPSALPATGSASEIEAVFHQHLASARIE
ncbi:hypothetical protein [Streptomyces puniciscabiei]|uniref:hypothetical protein n=1 Tax=Streptomyces puniciscabiei TaxID=164348 RepID=UPI0033252016